MGSPVQNEDIKPAPSEGLQDVYQKDPDNEMESVKPVIVEQVALGDEGARRIELMQQVWGKHGKLEIFIGIGLCMLVYELEYTTFTTYFNYALSDFNRVASTAALSCAMNLSFSLVKPLWAKTSDIFGRGEMYPAAAVLILTGLVAASTSKTFEGFAAGCILRVVGTTALNSINTIVIADVTSTRHRGFAVNFQFFPYLVLPWISSYIVERVVSPGGIGWHWGVGMMAIIVPVGILPVAIFLIKYQQHAKKLERQFVDRPPSATLYSFCSNVDLGGLVILIASLALILIPLSLASLQPAGYRTPWVTAFIIIGDIGLIFCFPWYEDRIALRPFFPLRYPKHRAIGLAFLLYFTDYMAAGASHGFLYNWALIAQGLTVMQATNLSYINGVFTFVAGMLFGLVMWRTRTYKWWIMGGCVIRLIGYGVMFRIRNSHPHMAELFIVQIVQGLGDGIVQTGGYVAATVNVPHRETAQMVALIVCIGMLGRSVGDAISGAIYTGTFRQELAKELGSRATPELIEALFNSITNMIPDWGTPERIAINQAYNHVTSYFFIAAMVIIAPGFLLVYFLPNQKLNQNLLEEHGMFGDDQRVVTSTHHTTVDSKTQNA